MFPKRSVKMIDGSEKRNRQLAFELQNSHVCEKRSKSPSVKPNHKGVILPKLQNKIKVTKSFEIQTAQEMLQIERNKK